MRIGKLDKTGGRERERECIIELVGMCQTKRENECGFEVEEV